MEINLGKRTSHAEEWKENISYAHLKCCCLTLIRKNSWNTVFLITWVTRNQANFSRALGRRETALWVSGNARGSSGTKAQRTHWNNLGKVGREEGTRGKRSGDAEGKCMRRRVEASEGTMYRQRYERKWIASTKNASGTLEKTHGWTFEEPTGKRRLRCKRERSVIL